MALPYERDIADLKEDVGSARDRRGATVLLGAGASISAGIPLASGFCRRIEESFPEKYRRAKAGGGVGYQHLMAALTPDQRRVMLGGAIDEARINWAHIALACLIRDGYVTRVLTPNFDPLVVQACALVNVFPSIYDFAASPTFKPSHVGSPAVYYLHGQRSGFRLLNTEEECGAHTASLKPVFDEAGEGRPWIVVGYSGQNDPVFDALLRKRDFDGGLYWVSRRDDAPGSHLSNGFLDAAGSKFLVQGYDADSFFMRLADQLDCFPPDLVRDPFGHLQGTYDRIVTSYPKAEGGEGGDLLLQARETVRRAAEADAAPSKETADSDDLTDLRLALATGDYDRVFAAWERNPSPSRELADLAASALTWQGADLAVESRQVLDAAEARAGFERAIEKYAAAVAVKPDKHEALNNWAVTLADIARRTDDAAEARAGFERAIEKFVAAVALKPDDHKALSNWGVALASIAKRTDDAAEARAGFERAIEKFVAAVALKPDRHEVLYNWGGALAEIAGRTDDPERVASLLDEAEDVLLRAVSLNPSKCYNLACLYARRGQTDEARRLLMQAREAGTLPDADHLRADLDLASLQEEPWFQDLLGPSDADTAP